MNTEFSLHFLFNKIKSQGEDIVKLDDKMDLMTKVDSDVLSRIATAMIQVATPEEVKKN